MNPWAIVIIVAALILAVAVATASDPRRTTVSATITEGWAAHSARLAEELDACRVRCHVCGARVYVGETAHDVEPGDDGAERFACAGHCETCR